jgi:uncharacterized membrane protein YwzB
VGSPLISGARTLALLALPASALLLLAAHLLHAGWTVLATLALLLLALLFVRRRWAMRVLQVVLAAATVEWVLTAVTLARLRMAHEQPYLRLLLILGAVAVVTAVAAWVFERPRLRERYRP